MRKALPCVVKRLCQTILKPTTNTKCETTFLLQYRWKNKKQDSCRTDSILSTWVSRRVATATIKGFVKQFESWRHNVIWIVLCPPPTPTSYYPWQPSGNKKTYTEFEYKKKIGQISHAELPHAFWDTWSWEIWPWDVRPFTGTKLHSFHMSHIMGKI